MYFATAIGTILDINFHKMHAFNLSSLFRLLDVTPVSRAGRNLALSKQLVNEEEFDPDRERTAMRYHTVVLGRKMSMRPKGAANAPTGANRDSARSKGSGGDDRDGSMGSRSGSRLFMRNFLHKQMHKKLDKSGSDQDVGSSVNQ